jgi:serine/threonine-protein kinase HipA
VRIRYEAEYGVDNLGAHDYRALSVRAPVDLAVRQLPHWPSFLVDLLPQGAARKRIEKLAASTLSPWDLLERGAVNPVGNVRIHPSQPRTPPTHHRGFDLREMIERGDQFVDYALGLGAAVAGATDTQGDAPKFWVVEDQQGRWHPDSGELAFEPARHALLKFPVPEAGPRAEDILRHEEVYQRVAQRCGLRVANELPSFCEGALLIPRFDRRVVNGREIRLGVESLYSMAGVIDSSVSTLRHDQVLIALARYTDDFPGEFNEYVRRDLLNLALGNRDNHGRNAALLKDVDGRMALAPIYDFGPAFLDARAIARVIRWDGEEPGGGAWAHVRELLDVRFEEAGLQPPSAMFSAALRQALPQLQSLPALMRECGADEHVVIRRQPEVERLVTELAESKA